MKLKSQLYSLGPALFRRPDLNHPPTSVCGIRVLTGLKGAVWMRAQVKLTHSRGVGFLRTMIVLAGGDRVR
jgi:hypothetical protein